MNLFTVDLFHSLLHMAYPLTMTMASCCMMQRYYSTLCADGAAIATMYHACSLPWRSVSLHSAHSATDFLHVQQFKYLCNFLRGPVRGCMVTPTCPAVRMLSGSSVTCTIALATLVARFHLEHRQPAAAAILPAARCYYCCATKSSIGQSTDRQRATLQVPAHYAEGRQMAGRKGQARRSCSRCHREVGRHSLPCHFEVRRPLPQAGQSCPPAGALVP